MNTACKISTFNPISQFVFFFTSNPSKSHLGIHQRQVALKSGRACCSSSWNLSCSSRATTVDDAKKTLVIGLGADSGCGKTTFMRRLTSVFGGKAEYLKNGNPDSNTLVSDTTTVICLDDYHLLDREGRKLNGLTALHPKANNFDLMYEQINLLKQGVSVEKPIYNHSTGCLDPPEIIHPPKILIVEGLHPM